MSSVGSQLYFAFCLIIVTFPPTNGSYEWCGVAYYVYAQYSNQLFRVLFIFLIFIEYYSTLRVDIEKLWLFILSSDTNLSIYMLFNILKMIIFYK